MEVGNQVNWIHLFSRSITEIQITFQSTASQSPWSFPIDTSSIEVKYQAISFQTPVCPWVISARTAVNVIVQQGNTVLKLLEYSYIPQGNWKYDHTN